MAKYLKFAIECDRNSENSQNGRKSWAILKKDGFLKKNDSLETAEGSELAVECN